jgi:large subunit ribosomal protein L24
MVKKKLPVKIKDLVTIISGFYKNKTGEIIKINKKTGKVVVKGINFKFKHMKSQNDSEKVSAIKKFEAPIDHSNVKLNVKKVS